MFVRKLHIHDNWHKVISVYKNENSYTWKFPQIISMKFVLIVSLFALLQLLQTNIRKFDNMI